MSFSRRTNVISVLLVLYWFGSLEIRDACSYDRLKASWQPGQQVEGSIVVKVQRFEADGSMLVHPCETDPRKYSLSFLISRKIPEWLEKQSAWALYGCIEDISDRAFVLHGLDTSGFLNGQIVFLDGKFSLVNKTMSSGEVLLAAHFNGDSNPSAIPPGSRIDADTVHWKTWRLGMIGKAKCLLKVTKVFSSGAVSVVPLDHDDPSLLPSRAFKRELALRKLEKPRDRDRVFFGYPSDRDRVFVETHVPPSYDRAFLIIGMNEGDAVKNSVFYFNAVVEVEKRNDLGYGVVRVLKKDEIDSYHKQFAFAKGSVRVAMKDGSERIILPDAFKKVDKAFYLNGLDENGESVSIPVKEMSTRSLKDVRKALSKK